MAKIMNFFRKLLNFIKNLISPKYKRLERFINSKSDDELQDLEMYCDCVLNFKDNKHV